MLFFNKYTSAYRHLCFVLLCLSTLRISAQQLVTTTEILSNNILDNETLPYSANINFIDKDAKRIPLIQGYQFRTESDEFNIEQQQYSLRFSFNSPKERKAYDKVLATSKDLYKVMQTEYAQNKMEQIYDAILSAYFIKEELVFLASQKVLLIDRRTVLSKLLQNSDEVEIKNWLSNEDNILSIALDSIELAHQLEEKKTLLFGSTSKRTIDFSEFITLEKIKNFIENLDVSKINSSRYLASEIKEQKAEAEFELEKAEANKWLDFAQLQYRGDDDLSFQKEISLGTSINIPYKGNNQIKKDEAALRVLERKYEKEIEKSETSSDIGELILKLKSEFAQREDLRQLIANQRLQETYEAYLNIGNVSPLLLLDLQKNILKYNSKLLDNKKKIFELYLETISKGSFLIQQPRINYLSNTLDEY